jgi:membrane protein DedA with SNARE-associated domain
MTALFQKILNWYLAHITYYTIILLMAIESSFIPLPSEIIIPPAAYKAATGDMNIFLVILCGSLGALLGALFNYYFALVLGRKIIYRLANTKIANMMFIDEHAVVKAENYFNDHGNTSTFIGRLVPGIRHLISIPAGLAKMNLRNFIMYTVIGATIWNIILSLLGYLFYTQQDRLKEYFTLISYAFLVIFVLFVVYLAYKGIHKLKKHSGRNNHKD